MTDPPLGPSPRRVRRRFTALAVGAVALVAAGCIRLPPPPPLPPEASQYCLGAPPTAPAHYQQAFDGLRTVWTEWVGADGSYPVALPDGRVLWLFGDTLLGRLNAYGSILSPGLINNSFVLQDGACFAPLMGGSRRARTDMLPRPAQNEWYWPIAGVVEANGTVLKVFAYHMFFVNHGGGGFDFDLKSIDVATFSLPGVTLQGPLVPLALPTVPSYGDGVTLGADDPSDPNDPYIYVYGREGQFLANPPNTEQQVARVPVGQETAGGAPWQFYDSSQPTGWSVDPNTATPMLFPVPAPGQSGSGGPEHNGPLAGFTVIPYGQNPDGSPAYLASAKLIDVFSDEVSTWVGPKAWGPWTFKGRAATTGAIEDYGNGRFTFRYGGRVLTLPGNLTLVLWSQNHNPLSEVIANNWLYRVFYAAPDPSSLPS